ncbi:hypothetical protein AB6A40_010211 [Gnathostoma spinigerum]|uniref:Amine oxidase domain-containing protein n=1 Tax=Gnathostoma spinigerum TaxID=75299 RepID=A0ABD6EWK9_9BILA
MWQSPSVGIVGCGMAGLSAAAHLHQLDFHDVTIYEASNRVGGRIYYTEEGDGLLMQHGAQFVDGTDTPIYRMAKELGVSMRLVDTRNRRTVTGCCKPNKDDMLAFAKFAEEFGKKCHELGGVPGMDVKSLGEVLDIDYQKFIEEHPNNESLFENLKKLIRSEYEINWATRVEEVHFIFV